MAIISIIEKLESLSLEKSGFKWETLRICELGSQYYYPNSELSINSNTRQSAKSVYLSRNVIKHVSIDLNGEYDSLVLDLDNPVPEYLLGDFNWVTNYGTVEHVNNQYMVFKNIHDLCCIGGIMLHALVPPGHWVGHGRYHHSIEFINKLAQCCRYSILLLEKTKYYDNPKKKRAICNI